MLKNHTLNSKWRVDMLKQPSLCSRKETANARWILLLSLFLHLDVSAEYIFMYRKHQVYCLIESIKHECRIHHNPINFYLFSFEYNGESSKTAKKKYNTKSSNQSIIRVFEKKRLWTHYRLFGVHTCLSVCVYMFVMRKRKLWYWEHDDCDGLSCCWFLCFFYRYDGQLWWNVRNMYSAWLLNCGSSWKRQQKEVFLLY